MTDTAAAREAALAQFIADLDRQVVPLSRELNEAMWNANTTGDPKWEETSAALDSRLRRIFADAASFAKLRAWREEGGAHDPLLARQLGLLIDTFQANQIPPDAIDRMVKIEKALESRFNNFRADFRGEKVADNRLRDVLRQSADPAERREAWTAMKQVGAEVRDDLLALVRMRNQAARDLGFPNYSTMMLQLDELDETWLFETLRVLEEGTRPLFEAYKRDLDARLAERFRIAPAELRPWHYSDPFFQEAPAADVDLDVYFSGASLEDLTRRFYHAIGLEVDDLLAKADLYERPGKSQHAFCLCVDRKLDIRVLCNCRPNEYWMATMLHEFGHAVYDKYVDPSLPHTLRGPAHILATEASAMLFGRLSKNAAWLHHHAQVSRSDAEAAGAAIARAVRSQLLVQTRWCLVMCHMERALYANPDQDLDTRWWDLVERLQFVTRPDGRHAPDWASKIHFSVAPVYYQNYQLGEMMASQLQHHLLHAVAGGGPKAWDRYVTSPEVGRFLRDRFYASGRRYDWRETLKRATGEEFTPESFVAELAGRS